MKTDREWDQLVSATPGIPFNGKLCRAVAKLSFDKSNQYLFTSARRNRCNPDGVACIYLSADRNTALAEYDKYFTDSGDDQPCLFYTGNLQARAIIDLGDAATVSRFGLANTDFFQAFRVSRQETPLEKLGRAVLRQNRICAIRFPSDAMHAKSAAGFNLAIYKQALVSPDSLQILGPKGTALELWP